MIVEALCWTDGASRGNPGRASIGVVIKNLKTNETHKFSEYLGNRFTNNHAEYSAVIFCLKKLTKFSLKSFELRSDSKLLVQQINGKYQVSSPNIRVLYREVMELLKTFRYHKFIHVPREENSLADSLANQALD